LTGAEFGAVLKHMLAKQNILYEPCVFIRLQVSGSDELVPHQFYTANSVGDGQHSRMDVLLEHEDKPEAHYSLLVLKGDLAVADQDYMINARMMVATDPATTIDVKVHPTRGESTIISTNTQDHHDTTI
jgi:hypothetical protein